jgi:hypothetical protein
MGVCDGRSSQTCLTANIGAILTIQSPSQTPSAEPCNKYSIASLNHGNKLKVEINLPNTNHGN